MKNNFFISAHGNLSLTTLVLQDKPWEEFNHSDIPEYLKDGYEIFSKRFENFKNAKRAISLKEEQELEFMLSSLIYAKNSLYLKNSE